MTFEKLLAVNWMTQFLKILVDFVWLFKMQTLKEILKKENRYSRAMCSRLSPPSKCELERKG